MILSIELSTPVGASLDAVLGKSYQLLIGFPDFSVFYIPHHLFFLKISEEAKEKSSQGSVRSFSRSALCAEESGLKGGMWCSVRNHRFEFRPLREYVAQEDRAVSVAGCV